MGDVEDLPRSIETPGGVLKTVKRAGPNPAVKPWPRDRVWVHYVGTLEDGTRFDSSHDKDGGKPFQFTLGGREVIRGLDSGVASMAVGEVAVLTVPPEYGYGVAGSWPKVPGGATLIFEVELLKAEGQDLSEAKDGSIVKRVLKQGTKRSGRANDGSRVTVDVVGKCDLKVFDRRESVTFTLGEGLEIGIPRALERGIEQMYLDEEAQITLAPTRAGTEDPSGVDRSSHLTYEVKLKGLQRATEVWEMDGLQKLECSQRLKEQGTNFFLAGKVQLASIKYSKVIETIRHEVSLSGEEEEQRRELLKAAYLNLALCNLKEDLWMEARDLCSKVIDDYPPCTKAFFRRGEALLKLDDFERAKSDFQEALRLEPENKAALGKVTACNNLIKEQKVKDKKMFGNMFEKFAQSDQAKEQNARRNQQPLVINEWDIVEQKGQNGLMEDLAKDLAGDLNGILTMSNG